MYTDPCTVAIGIEQIHVLLLLDWTDSCTVAIGLDRSMNCCYWTLTDPCTVAIVLESSMYCCYWTERSMYYSYWIGQIHVLLLLDWSHPCTGAIGLKDPCIVAIGWDRSMYIVAIGLNRSMYCCYWIGELHVLLLLDWTDPCTVAI